MSICVICADTLVKDTPCTTESRVELADDSLQTTTRTGAEDDVNAHDEDEDETSSDDDDDDDDEGSDSVVRLECGHSFHCKCAIQWFRYNHACCPLCRATHIESSWKIKTPGQRVAIMRRNISKLPRFIQNRVRKCDSISTKLASNLSELREFRRVYSELLKKERTLNRSVRTLTHQKKKLVRELAWFSAPGVPYLHTPSTRTVLSENDDEEDFDESDDDPNTNSVHLSSNENGSR